MMVNGLQYDRMQEMSVNIGTLLVQAVREHGAPNSFSFSEIVGPRDAMLAGKAVRKHWDAFTLNVRARLAGEFGDVSIDLSGGRIHVGVKP